MDEDKLTEEDIAELEVQEICEALELLAIDESCDEE